MIPGKYSGIVTCIAAAGMGMFVAVWLLDFALIRTDWCGNGNDNCFREWLGALSGWVAAVGALGAALLTLPHLRQQAIEAKRQADFILGDSRPTFDVYSETFAEVYLRVVNWNRRTLLIDAIHIANTDFDILDIKLARNEPFDKRRHVTEGWDFLEFLPAIRVAGYDDRNLPPEICTFKIIINEEVGVVELTQDFKVHGRLLGDKYASLTLEAQVTIFAAKYSSVSHATPR